MRGAFHTKNVRIKICFLPLKTFLVFILTIILNSNVQNVHINDEKIKHKSSIKQVKHKRIHMKRTTKRAHGSLVSNTSLSNYTGFHVELSPLHSFL